MTEAQFREKAINNVKQLIDCIAAHEYEKLHTIATISSSWCSKDKTQEDGIAEFTEWLDEQLKLWAEYEGKEFVVDPFEEQHFEILHFEEHCVSAAYNPQSHGEPLDFWFELDFGIEDDGSISLEFEINI